MARDEEVGWSILANGGARFRTRFFEIQIIPDLRDLITLKNRSKSKRIVACMTFTCMLLVLMSWNLLIHIRDCTELAIIKIGNIRQISLCMLVKRILTKILIPFKKHVLSDQQYVCLIIMVMVTKPIMLLTHAIKWRRHHFLLSASIVWLCS